MLVSIYKIKIMISYVLIVYLLLSLATCVLICKIIIIYYKLLVIILRIKLVIIEFAVFYNLLKNILVIHLKLAVFLGFTRNNHAKVNNIIKIEKLKFKVRLLYIEVIDYNK